MEGYGLSSNHGNVYINEVCSSWNKNLSEGSIGMKLMGNKFSIFDSGTIVYICMKLQCILGSYVMGLLDFSYCNVCPFCFAI